MSKYCIKCCQEIEDEAKFCDFCGEKQPMSGIPPIKAAAEFGTLPNETSSASTTNTFGKKRRGLIVMIAIAMVVLIVLGAVVMVFFHRGSASENAMIWVEDGSYMYSRDISSDADPIEITSLRSDNAYATGYAVITADGEYAYFVNYYTSSDTGALYRVQLGKLTTKGDKNENYIEKLDTNVRENTFNVLDDGTLLYMCGEDGSNAELHYYDGDGVRTMKSGVVGYRGYYDNSFNYGYCVTDDQKVAVYTSEAEDYTYTIYCQNIGAIGGYDFEVDSGTSGYAIYDAAHILYEKYDFSDDNDIVEVYVGGMDVEPVRLADDAESTCELNVFTETGMFYYTVAGETSEVMMSDYVTNPHAEEDAAAEEPSASDYEETVTKTDSWTGETYTTTEFDWDAYEEDWNAWYAGTGMREEFLYLLEEMETTLTSYELYCYSAASDESVLITSECGDRDPNVSVMSGESVAIYKKTMTPDEKISIDDIVSFVLDYIEFFYEEEFEDYYEEYRYSDYTSDYDSYGLDIEAFYGDEELEEVVAAYINAYLASAAGNDGYYYTISGAEEKQLDTSGLELSDCQVTDVQLFDSGKRIAVAFDGDIYLASVYEKNIGTLTVANASYGADSLLCADNDELYYLIYGFRYDYDAALYRYRDDAWDTLILEGIESGKIYEDGSMTLLSDYTNAYGSTLTVINASGDVKTFEDVANYTVLSNGNIVMRSSDNILKLYDGKEETTIAHDVVYSTYYSVMENGISLDIY